MYKALQEMSARLFAFESQLQDITDRAAADNKLDAAIKKEIEKLVAKFLHV